ncbi:transcription factor bHLH122-like [Silene latifolia]|uniref:transcription factor bHLH122-like n=1 Tax=Silene latifolia TaxID=37657 RepID=UPI003D783880
MDSDFQQKQYQHHFQGLQKEFHNQKQQLHSLTRFRSAPTSYFASFLDAADAVTTSAGGAGGAGGGDEGYKGDFSNSRPLSPETENIFARFMSSMGDGNNSSANKLSDIPENSQMQPESMARVKQEDDFTTAPQMMYQSASKPPLANHHNLGSAEAKVVMNSTPHMKTGIGGSNGFSLARHSSSPAGFFADFNIDGYDVTKGMGNYGGNDQMNYSSGQPTSTSGIVRQNSDVQGTLMRMNSLEETKFNINQNKDSNFTTGIPMSSWEDSILSETFSSLDGGGDDGRIFSEHNSSENQIGEKRSRPRPLAHHLSLPNTSSELSSMDNQLHLQDGVLLRSRAKRGCATHPRSIAERVRRTKISERMRKLQDLVPNMDKQTNTSDMLDLAVDYIKDLQMKVKHLHCIREKCTCPR